MINRPFAESKYQKHRFIQLSKDKKYVQLSVTENVTFDTHIIMMPGLKDLNPHELAHRWVKDLGTRPDMSIKVG